MISRGRPLEDREKAAAFLGDAPRPRFTHHQCLAEDIKPGHTFGETLHASGPFLPTRVEDGKVLLDDLEAGASVGLPVENLQDRKLETHKRLRRYHSPPPYM